jgi:catechol 2,3-dioxygenase
MASSGYVTPDAAPRHPGLPDATAIGTVALTVADLERSITFYRDRLGLDVRRRDAATAWFGVAGDAETLLAVTALGGARAVAGTTGLYHFAILVPTRVALARALQHLAETNTPIQGLSDHLVSEAIYLADPDGNGIEIYADRPRADWPRLGGRVRMTTQALDITDLLATLHGIPSPAGPYRLPSGTTIGHIHLQVSDLAAAEAFYVDALGFDLVTRYGRMATFVSAGGYHHHVGLNTWAGTDAPPPPADATGLREFRVVVPDESAREAITERLTARQIPFTVRGDSLVVRDPADNIVVIGG